MGRVAAVFCIARFLADIVSPRATAITRTDRRKRAVYDYTVSFGVPAIAMACSALYQPYRYRITRGVGCGVPVVSCWPVLSLRVIWPPVFAIGGMLYSRESPVIPMHEDLLISLYPQCIPCIGCYSTVGTSAALWPGLTQP